MWIFLGGLVLPAWPACSEDSGQIHDAGIGDQDSAGGLLPDAKSCEPAAPVPNLHLFTALEADLQALSGAAARRERIDTFFADVKASGDFPVRDASTVVFLYRGAPAAPVSVVGTFNGWSNSADPMQQFPESDLYYLEKTLGSGRQEYRFAEGEASQLRDQLNKHVVWDGVQASGWGSFNSVIPPYDGVDPDGELHVYQVASPQLDNSREVYVLLPVDYLQESCRSYPVLFVNDGNDSLTQGEFDKVATTTFAAKQARPAILVFVSLPSPLLSVREAEYSCETASQGPSYADFLCDTLAPLIDASYRTIGTADARGIIGFSMGGLISYAAAFWRNDCFHLVGAQSGAFWFPKDSDGNSTNMMVDRVLTMPTQTIKQAYLDNGVDNSDSTLLMEAALTSKGYPVYYWENVLHGHNFGACKDRFDEALSTLFPP